MLTLLGRRRARANRLTIEALHGAIVAAARQPAFYTHYGVADTFEGRFEMLTLLACLVLRRLNGLPPPGPEMAQNLIDTLFRHLDPALREMGVGDLGVPKRMKRLAEGFLGRSAAYDAALRNGEDDLAVALGRNVYAGAADARRLARYVFEAERQIGEVDVHALSRGTIVFPDPSDVS